MHLWAHLQGGEAMGRCPFRATRPGDVEAVITSMKRLRPRQEHVQKEVRKAMDYFQTNKERMRYAQFRSQGLFVGSGVVEAGCNAGNIVTRSLPLKAAPGFISTGICPA